MRLTSRMTEKKLKVLEKTTACGVVPEVIAMVIQLSGGSLAENFALSEVFIN